MTREEAALRLLEIGVPNDIVPFRSGIYRKMMITRAKPYFFEEVYRDLSSCATSVEERVLATLKLVLKWTQNGLVAALYSGGNFFEWTSRNLKPLLARFNKSSEAPDRVQIGLLIFGLVFASIIGLLAHASAASVLVIFLIAAASLSALAAILTWLLLGLLFLATVVITTTLYSVVFNIRASQRVVSGVSGVFYSCPMCNERGNLPAYECSCGHLCPDLYPSNYGIFHHICVQCEKPIPTLGILGRSRLAKRCAKCASVLNYSEDKRERHFAFVGGQSSGKSTLLVCALWQLLEQYFPLVDIKYRFPYPADLQALRADVMRLRNGDLLLKTRNLRPRAFSVVVSPPDSRESLLHIYDAAGEVFTNPDNLSSHHKLHSFVDGIVLVVDPFSDEGATRKDIDPLSKLELSQINPCPVPTLELLNHLILFLENARGVTRQKMISIPIAVVLTKLDARKLAEKFYIPLHHPRPNMTTDEILATLSSRSDMVRMVLLSWGFHGFIDLLEARFDNILYSGASALGRMPSSDRKHPFRPISAADSLIWLLDRTYSVGNKSTLREALYNTRASLR